MKRTWWKSGFALLEVAVVATFVSSVSFTAYQVIRKGNEAACQNNLKQIYLALVMNNGSLPNAVFFCPAVPSELNKHGINYLWNDTVSGKNLDGISRVVTAGRECKLKVIFSDRYGNEIPEYAGELEFTSSD